MLFALQRRNVTEVRRLFCRAVLPNNNGARARRRCGKVSSRDHEGWPDAHLSTAVASAVGVVSPCPTLVRHRWTVERHEHPPPRSLRVMALRPPPLLGALGADNAVRLVLGRCA